jgi:hypothetical protein
MRRYLFLAVWIFGLLALPVRPEEEIVAPEESAGTPASEVNAASVPSNHFMDFGTGLGLDYGGLVGINYAYMPIPYISFFIATGWELITLGWNTGIKIHVLPQDSKHVFRLNFKAMYGVNGATVIIGESDYDKTFVGFTPGIGFEFMFGSQKKNGFDIDLNFPIHGSDFDAQVKRIKADYRVSNFNDPLPVAFSMGYHHEF